VSFNSLHSLLLPTLLIAANSCAGKASPSQAAAGEAPMAAPEAAADLAPAEPGADGEVALVAAIEAPEARREAAAVAAAGGIQREFPAPDYSAEYDGPRVDFRETVHWAPSVKTGESGSAEVSFYLSDAVTEFRATAEGMTGDGLAGRGVAMFTSALPLSVAARLPLEVMRGDRLRVPVTLHNRGDRGAAIKLSTELGDALKLRRRAPRSIWVGKGAERTVLLDVEVAGAGPAAIEIGARTRTARDKLRRELKVALPGYPRARAFSGTLGERVAHRVDIPAAIVDGSVEAIVQLYPSPVSSMIAGTEAIIREPSGCFEQASSANYPNVMALAYMKEHNALDTKLVARTRTTLNNGYDKLTGYESADRGFEWFGGNPGHEALTAYGLMQFEEMTEVFPKVDRQMIARTRDWLRSRRDGKGGYKLSSRALDTFGRASQEVTDAYITFALTESGGASLAKDLARELARVEALADSSRDPYIVALAANALVNVKSRKAGPAVARLAAMQKADGRLGGADHSITRSGGIALEIETTALAAMAMLESPEHAAHAKRALDWITGQRGGNGQFSSTQATILALKALKAQAAASSRFEPGSAVAVVVNGKRVARLPIDGESSEPIRFAGLGRHLRPGRNDIELRGADGGRLEYSLGVSYRETRPTSSPETKVEIDTRLARRRVRVGKAIAMTAAIRNRTAAGLPMVIARIGIPGGLESQRWQLDELVAKKAIDFYETREREVILYFRSMAPGAEKAIELQLLATVPGTFSSPPAAAYLYYTDEHRDYAPPVRVSVDRPRRRARKEKTDAK
jgi:uncharacterized protein YfaS (alpha-2-macroglobulin family)